MNTPQVTQEDLEVAIAQALNMRTGPIVSEIRIIGAAAAVMALLAEESPTDPESSED